MLPAHERDERDAPLESGRRLAAPVGLEPNGENAFHAAFGAENARPGRSLHEWDTDRLSMLVPNPLDSGELPTLPIEKLPTAKMPALRPDAFTTGDVPPDEVPTWILPVVGAPTVSDVTTTRLRAAVAGAQGYVTLVGNLLKSSGIYALASLGGPLIALILAPYLTHNLSPTDFGRLTILTTVIGLTAGITQLGLGSAFFRAYNYDFTADHDRRDVLATVTTLLFLISLPTVAVAWLAAPALAQVLLGDARLGPLVNLAAGAVLMQNLTVPAFAWMRAESRAGFFAVLAIANSLVTLAASILLVGVAGFGIAGAVAATGCGYAVVVLLSVPLALLRASARPRRDIAWSVLAFGTPMIVNVIANWVLGLSDRYLLGRFASYAETASYSVAYTLGTVLSTLIIGPFTLAWPTSMYSIARRKDAPQIFRLVFRWLGMLLLFAAFGLSLVATVALNWLFPPSYHASAPIIPIVAVSLVFNGIYYVVSTGANIRRKTWIAAIFMTIAALSNVGLNLFLIPHYGAMGAAIATLLAYIVLATLAYVVNQRLYYVPFEMGRFALAALAGTALYVGAAWLGARLSSPLSWLVSGGALLIYAVCLGVIGNIGGTLRTQASRLAARR
jgi:O-antigen/teichoic acid export membrane protein